MNKDKKVNSLQELGKLMGQNTTKSQYHQGIIKKYISEKGFGFIQQDDGNDLFFHVSDVQKGTPAEGVLVKYIIGEGREGKKSAKKIIVQQSNQKSSSMPVHELKERLYLPEDTQAIFKPAECGNFSLSLNKFVEWEVSKKDSKKEISNNFLKKITDTSLLDSISNCSVKRYDLLVTHLKPIFYLRTLSFLLDWRMIVGLGTENVHETSMTLHHIYGIPYIPGSALKGIARDGAIAELCSEAENEKPDVMEALISMPDSNETDKEKREKEITKYGKIKRQNGDPAKPEDSTIDKIITGWPKFETTRKIFGGQKQAGKIIFFDAFPEKDVTIKLDIMNPHYPKYYSDGNPPADWQNPTPIKFLTVENTSFNFALALNKKETDKNRNNIDSDPALLDAAEKWLRKALEEHGVGAKTSVGYGYFSV
ncbi:MAG: type III-B CRISPR module RAMP protein Cmr6 [Methanosarcinaceae archaeon]